MTMSSLPNRNPKPVSIEANHLGKPSESTAEIIRALTPILIAAIGGVIGVIVLLKNPDNQAGFGLASAAIAGAAGLAQPNKNQKDQ
ncbi:MAG: hypothetical protein OHK0047_41270 [Leptolyngbyaceae cyanobacterium]|uniref:hypothetical protein n=1 Tax=Leptodesmis TaxID=2664261 RepID=UPI001F33D52C|nr:hypothetical protein [Leptodesmis sichuanensis]UIE37331.1 hypothetical protein KIK02_20670 [Leptodesmis sichuanensis A121]